MPTDNANELSAILKELDSPLETVRLDALKKLAGFPSLGFLRALRRAAGTDPSAIVRAEASRILAEARERLAHGAGGVAPGGSATGTTERCRALLAAPDPTVRAKVVASLAMSFDPGVPGLLRDAMAHETDPFVLVTLLHALAATGGRDAAQEIVPWLAHADPRVRETAVEALEASGDPEALRRVLKLLEDPHHRVRAAVARAMKAHEPEAVLRTLDGMLGGADEMSVRAALYVLRYFEETIAVPRIREKLSSRAPEGVRAMARDSLAILAQKGSRRAIAVLGRLASASPSRSPSSSPSPSPAPSVPAAGLSDAGSSPVAGPLDERLAADAPDARLEALREVVRLGRRDLVPALRQRFAAERDLKVVSALVAALGRLGSASDAGLVEPFLKSDEPRVRANAVEALGWLAGASAAPRLIPLLSDRSNRVCANAIVALARAGAGGAGEPGGLALVEGVDVLAALRMMAAHSDPRFAHSAIWAAATIATPASVRVLAGLLRSPDAEVSRRARAALGELAKVMVEAADALRDEGGPAAGAGPDAVAAAHPAEAGDAAAVERLLFDLRHDSAEVRLASMQKIARMKDPRLVAAVSALLRDEDANVRRIARETVRSMVLAAEPARPPGASGPGDPAALAAAEAELAAAGDRAKAEIARALETAIRCGAAPVAQALAARLPLEDDTFLRAQMLSALALLGDASVVPLIQAFVRDPDPRVRANAVDALDLVGVGQDLKSAVACLADPDPRVRAAAISASLSIYREPFLTHLREMLASADVAERSAGLYALLAVNLPERPALISDYFRSEVQPRLYESAADALVREMVPAGLSELRAIAAGLPDSPKRAYLEKRLRQVEEGFGLPEAAGTPPADFGSLGVLLDRRREGKLTPELIRSSLARETDPIAIIFLLDQAAEQKLPDQLELAQPFIHSRDRRIRLAATEVLGKLDDPEAAECIASMVRDRDAEVAQRAAELLERKSPESALAGVRALLDTGEAWAIRRGLDLIERRGPEVGLPLALSVLEQEPQPAIVEPLMRLLVAWGTPSVLDRIADMYGAAGAAARPLLAQVGSALGERLGLAAPATAARFSPGAVREPEPGRSPAVPSRVPVRTRAPATGAGSRAPLPRAPISPPPAIDLDARQLKTAAALGLLLSVCALAAFWPSRGPGRDPRGAGLLAPSASAPPAMVVLPEAPRGDTSTLRFLPIAFPAPAPAEVQEPTLDSVKERLALVLAPKGIRSAALIHMMALDRVRLGYRAEILKALEAADQGRFLPAIQILQAAYEKLEEEHVAGRVAVLKAMEQVARAGQRWDVVKWCRDQFATLRTKILETCLAAAREGSIPEEKVRAMMARLDQREKEKAKVGRGADWLAGNDIAEGGDAAADRSATLKPAR
jgi:HEAT repeat protein